MCLVCTILIVTDSCAMLVVEIFIHMEVVEVLNCSKQ